MFTNLQILILAASLGLMLLLDQFVRRTRWGRAMRAVAQDAEAAGFMGVEVNTVVTLTFLIGSVLAAGAGIMVGLYYGIVDFFMGYIAGLKAFTAAVLGGIGNLRGAMLGGLLLGARRELRRGVHRRAVAGRHRVRGAHHRAGLPPGRAAGRATAREGLSP